MKEHPRRFVLWLLMLAVSGLLMLQGHPISHLGETVPFLPGKSAVSDGLTIRLEGDCVKAGVYCLERNQSLGTVINMTVPFLWEKSCNLGALQKTVSSGDVLSVACSDGERTEITRDVMQVVEKMILAIPLDPNNLTVAEWEVLPLIGPSLAKRIVRDRQENGEFRSFRDLDRVSGIGPAILIRLECYFDQEVYY